MAHPARALTADLTADPGISVFTAYGGSECAALLSFSPQPSSGSSRPRPP